MAVCAYCSTRHPVDWSTCSQCGAPMPLPQFVELAHWIPITRQALYDLEITRHDSMVREFLEWGAVAPETISPERDFRDGPGLHRWWTRLSNPPSGRVRRE